MAWKFDNGSICDKDGRIVCIVLPSISPFYLSIIKRTPDAIDLVFEFKDVYDSGRKMSKKLFDRFRDIVREDEEFDFTWSIDVDGDLCDFSGIKICVFPDKTKSDFLFIKYLPNILNAIRVAVGNYRGSNAKQKPLYDALTRILRRIDEYP